MEAYHADLFRKEEVEAALATAIPTIGLLHVTESVSTNHDLMAMAESGAPGWTVLVSDRQTAGRGRRDRAWASPQGGLYTSILLHLSRDTSPITLIPLTVGLALAEALQSIAAESGEELSLTLKWPNDILTGNGKLAGILCETALNRTHWIVVAGVGVNILPLGPDLKRMIAENTPTSLMEECDIAWSREAVLIAFLYRLKERLEQWEIDPEGVRSDWTALSGLLGKNIRVRSGKETVIGIAEGISEIGALRIRTDKDLVEINAAEGIEVHD